MLNPYLYQYGVIPVLLCGAIFFIVSPILRFVIAPNDEGFFIHPSERITYGEKPFIDFHRSYWPGRVYPLAFAFKIFGLRWSVAQNFYLFLFILCMILYYFLSLMIFHHPLVSLIPVLITLLYLFPQGSFHIPTYAAFSMNTDKIIIICLAILSFSLYIQSGKLIYLVVCGIISGVSLSLGPDVILTTLATILCGIVFKGSDIFFSLAVFSSTVLVLFFIQIFYLWVTGADIKDVWENEIKALFRYAQSTRLPYPKLDRFRILSFEDLSFMLYKFRFYNPFLVYGALLTLLIIKRVQGASSMEDFIVFQLLIFGIIYLNYLFHRADYFHLSVALAPYYILVSYLVYTIFTDMSIRKDYDFVFFLEGYILLLMVIVLIFEFISFVMGYCSHIREKQEKTFLDFERGDVLVPEPYYKTVSFVIHFIETHTKPNDYIFVLVSEPQLYFLTGRKNPTRITSVLPWFLKKDQQRMIHDLDMKKPQFIIFNKEEAEHSYQNGQSLEQYANRLCCYLKENYSQIEEYNPYLILKRKARDEL